MRKEFAKLLSAIFGRRSVKSTRKAPVYPMARLSDTRSKEVEASTGGKTYPVGIVGEASHQAAIRRCVAGERVQVVYEIGNPHDATAIAVLRRSGARIGYIGREHWLYRALNIEGKGCTATIMAIEGKPLGVVLDVALTNRQLGARDWKAQG